MPITFRKEDSLFRLTTKNTLYAFDLVKGRLIHRYYGRKAGAQVKTYADDPGRVWSFAPYSTEGEVHFSLDTQSLEYSYFDSGDFRTTALRIRNGAGNCVTDFTYVSHKIRRGRVDIPSIPCGRADDRTQTLDITLRDPASGCELGDMIGHVEDVRVQAKAAAAAIAKTGNVNDLVQTDGEYIVLYCGGAE